MSVLPMFNWFLCLWHVCIAYVSLVSLFLDVCIAYVSLVSLFLDVCIAYVSLVSLFLDVCIAYVSLVSLCLACLYCLCFTGFLQTLQHIGKEWIVPLQLMGTRDHWEHPEQALRADVTYRKGFISVPLCLDLLKQKVRQRSVFLNNQGSKFHLSVSPGQVDFPPDN